MLLQSPILVAALPARFSPEAPVVLTRGPPVDLVEMASLLILRRTIGSRMELGLIVRIKGILNIRYFC